MVERRAASEPLWLLATGAAIELISLAAETRTIAVALSTGALQLVDRTGQITSQWQSDALLAALAVSDDGRAVTYLDRLGNLHWRDRRGRAHWRQFVAEGVGVLAVDSTGWYAAIADTEARILLFDRHGRQTAQFPTPVPLVALAFSRERPELWGCSESGWVVAMSLEGELLWRTRVPGSPCELTMSAAALHVSSEAGITSLDVAGQVIGGLTAGGAAPRVAVAANGERLLLGDRSGATLVRLDGTPAWRYTSASPIIGVALDPLVRQAWLAISPNRLACFDLATDATR
jgi:hypothetical protein